MLKDAEPIKIDQNVIDKAHAEIKRLNSENIERDTRLSKRISNKPLRTSQSHNHLPTQNLTKR